MKIPVIILLAIFFLASCATTSQKKTFRVSGSLSDFNGHRLPNGEIHFQDRNFKNLISTTTDDKGEFTAEPPDRFYNSIFACKDYAKKYLEYWHWNYQSKENDFLDIKIDGLELYGVKAWSTRPTYKSLIVFFRPMSLSRALNIKNRDKNKVAPVVAELKLDGIRATIDGKETTLLGLNKIKEFITKDQSMDAYLVQISTDDFTDAIKRLCLFAIDSKTKEQGMSCVDL